MRLAPAAAILAIAAVAHAEPAPTKLDALLARTDQVAREVSKIRGLRLKKPIPNEVVDREELHARLLKMASDSKTKTETAAEGLALARWGLIPLGTDYEQLMLDLMTDQIAGYYDPETKKLTISKTAGDDPDWAEMVLAHELDHGLQDQAFDLKAFEDLPDADGDAAIARHALVEGDGIALMIEVLLAHRHLHAPWSNPEIAHTLDEAMAMPSGDSLDHAPLAIREEMLFPYRAGLAFVAALRQRHPWSAVDAAFKRPPRSTEQILHPEKYVAREVPIAITASVPPSLAGYSLGHETVWGELGFQLFLRAHGLTEEVADEAAAGWGGDRAIVLTKDGDARPERAIGVVRLDWDSEPDAIEAEEAAIRALDDAVVGASFDRAPPRTRWIALDGTVALVERRGTGLVIAIGVPARLADTLATEAWTALRRK